MVERAGGSDPDDAAREIGVVVLTHGRKDHPNRSLDRALRSVALQDYEGAISIFVLGDNCRAAQEIPRDLSRTAGLRLTEWSLSGDKELESLPEVSRVAFLRSAALRFVDSRYVCFLDDDNWWEPNHLSSLYAIFRERPVRAAHQSAKADGQRSAVEGRPLSLDAARRG